MLSLLSWQWVLSGVISFAVIFLGIWGVGVFDRRHPGWRINIPTLPPHILRTIRIISGVVLAVVGVWVIIAGVTIFPYVLDMLVAIRTHYPAYEAGINVLGYGLLVGGVFLGVSCVVTGIREIR